jgi:outer membrane protein assembly factor BamB
VSGFSRTKGLPKGRHSSVSVKHEFKIEPWVELFIEIWRPVLEVDVKNILKYLTLILCLVLIGQAQAQAVEPVLLLEKPINEKSVNSSFVNGKIIFSSREELSLSTWAGKESFRLKLKENQEVITSGNGEYFGITTYSTKGSLGSLKAGKFVLHSANGKALWQIENPRSSAFFIANNGKLVVGVSSLEGEKESELIFYNENVDSVFSTPIDFFQGLSFSPNGGVVFVQSGTDGLLVFDQKGAFKRNYKTCQQFSASPDGEYVACVFNGKLNLYHQEKLIAVARGENILARGIALSPDDKYVSLIDKKNLYLFDFHTGDLLWQYSLDQPELSFISVDLNQNGEMIAVGVDFDKGRNIPPQERHTQGYVYLFDKQGKLAWQEELSYKLWNAFVPQVKFSLDKPIFSAKTREKIYLFEIK